jgi:hypothetical protein
MVPGQRAKTRLRRAGVDDGAGTPPEWCRTSEGETMSTTAFQARAIMTVVAICFVAVVAVTPANTAFAQSASDHGLRNGAAAKTYAQVRSRSKRVRPRARIRVTPVYPYRLRSLPYPPPYDYEWPGPNAVRQCSARLVQEFRPSGTVIVPRTTCWWERG